jgi:hypothetical protein
MKKKGDKLSLNGLGVLHAVLGQRVGKLPHIIYYASKTLMDAQVNYITTEKEMQVVVFALDKF